MKLKEWLDQWSMTSLNINLQFLEMEWEPKDKDRDAAWELYVELLTRITTQRLPQEHGDEKTALDSVYKIFELTRDIIKRNGPECINFAKIAVIILNQVIRPFTADWHKKSLQGAFSDPVQCELFRKELSNLQDNLHTYMRMLADIAKVENLTELEET